MRYLTLDDLLHIAERTLDGRVEVRDVGLLGACAARPGQSVMGEDAYPTVHLKAAALLHSLVRNHALVDGNKRLGLAAVSVFYGLNGVRLTLSNDEAYDLVIAVAAGELHEVQAIGAQLEAGTQAWFPS